jgi:putative membrane protein
MAEPSALPVVVEDPPRAAPRPAADPRALQANERTLLAWVRTGIALMAFGFVVARFGAWTRLMRPDEAPASDSFPWIGAGLVVLGAVGNAVAGWRYLRIRRAMLAGAPIVAAGAAGVVLAALLAALGVALAVIILAS